jgi:hypothetical protein
VIVDRRNILPGSITVTSATGFPTYTEGFDYTVAYFPDRAEITVVIGANIADGQTILVDYTVGPEPSSDIDSVTTTVSVRYTFTETALHGLAFFTTYRTQDFNISTSDPSLFVLDDYRDLLYGTEFRRGGLRLLVQQDIHDSTTNPFTNTRLEADYGLRLGPDSMFSIELSRDLINYDDPDNDVVFDRIDSHWNQRLSRQWDMELRVRYFDESNELEGDSRGVDQSLALHWRKGRTTAYANIRNAFNFSDPSKTTSQTLELGFRRDF